MKINGNDMFNIQPDKNVFKEWILPNLHIFQETK